MEFNLESQYIDPAALRPNELDYELLLRDLEKTKGKNSKYRALHAAQEREIQTKTKPTQTVPDANYEIKIVSETLIEIDKMYREDKESDELSANKCEQIIYRLKHLKNRASRIQTHTTAQKINTQQLFDNAVRLEEQWMVMRNNKNLPHQSTNSQTQSEQLPSSTLNEDQSKLISFSGGSPNKQTPLNPIMRSPVPDRRIISVQGLNTTVGENLATNMINTREGQNSGGTNWQAN